MVRPQRHQIRKMDVALDVPWTASAASLHHEVQRLLSGDFRELLQARLDAVIPPDQLIQIQHLAIDLDGLSLENYRADLPDLLLDRIVEEVLSQIQAAPHSKVSVDTFDGDEKPGTRPGEGLGQPWYETPIGGRGEQPRARQHGPLAALAFFLEKGGLPWWYAVTQEGWAEAVKRLFRDAKTEVRSLLFTHRSDQQALRRIWRLSQSFQQAFWVMLAGDEAAAWIPTEIHSLAQSVAKRPRQAPSVAALEAIAVLAMQELLLQAGVPPQPESLRSALQAAYTAKRKARPSEKPADNSEAASSQISNTSQQDSLREGGTQLGRTSGFDQGSPDQTSAELALQKWLQRGAPELPAAAAHRALLFSLPVARLVAILRGVTSLTQSAQAALTGLPSGQLEAVFAALGGESRGQVERVRAEWALIARQLRSDVGRIDAFALELDGVLLAWLVAKADRPWASPELLRQVLRRFAAGFSSASVVWVLELEGAVERALVLDALVLPWQAALQAAGLSMALAPLASASGKKRGRAKAPTSHAKSSQSARSQADTSSLDIQQPESEDAPRFISSKTEGPENPNLRTDQAAENEAERLQLTVKQKPNLPIPQPGDRSTTTRDTTTSEPEKPYTSDDWSMRGWPERWQAQARLDVLKMQETIGWEEENEESTGFQPFVWSRIVAEWEAGVISSGALLRVLGAWGPDPDLVVLLAKYETARRNRFIDLFSPVHASFLQELVKEITALPTALASVRWEKTKAWEAVFALLLSTPATQLSRQNILDKLVFSQKATLKEALTLKQWEPQLPALRSYLIVPEPNEAPDPTQELMTLLQVSGDFVDWVFPEIISDSDFPENISPPKIIDSSSFDVAPVDSIIPDVPVLDSPSVADSTQLGFPFIETKTPLQSESATLSDTEADAPAEELEAPEKPSPTEAAAILLLQQDEALAKWILRLAQSNQRDPDEVLTRLRAAVSGATLPLASRLQVLLEAPDAWLPRPSREVPSALPGPATLHRLLQSAASRPSEWPGLLLLIGVWSAVPRFAEHAAQLPDETIRFLLRQLVPGYARFIQELHADGLRLVQHLRLSAPASPDSPNKYPKIQDIWQALLQVALTPEPNEPIKTQLVKAVLVGFRPMRQALPAAIQAQIRQLRYGRLLLAQLPASQPPRVPVEAEAETRLFLLQGQLPPGTEAATMTARLLEMARQHPARTSAFLRTLAPPRRLAGSLRLLFPTAELGGLVAALSGSAGPLLIEILKEVDAFERAVSGWEGLGTGFRVALMAAAIMRPAAGQTVELLEKSLLQAVEALSGPALPRWAQLAEANAQPALARLAARVGRKLRPFYPAPSRPQSADLVESDFDASGFVAWLDGQRTVPSAATLRTYLQINRPARAEVIQVLRRKDPQSAEISTLLDPEAVQLLLLEAWGKAALVFDDLWLLAKSVAEAGEKRHAAPAVWRQWLEAAVIRRQTPLRVLQRWLKSLRLSTADWQPWRAQLEVLAPLFLHPDSYFSILEMLAAVAPLAPATRKAPASETRPPARLGERPALAEYAVSNAGVALLWPFFGRYFEVLGLMQAGKFKNNHAQERAAFFLHYLCNGQTRPAEPELVLPKVFCGLDPAALLSQTGIRPSKEQKEITESLLSAAIQYWSTLGETSTAAFQESFLDRPGMLRVREQDFHLEVERRSYDLLLRTLPWGLNPVNLSWMSMMMEIEWSSKI